MSYGNKNMKKNKWALILEKDVGDIVVEKFSSQKIAEEELEYRNSLTIAMGYSPDVKYTIKKLQEFIMSDTARMGACEECGSSDANATYPEGS